MTNPTASVATCPDCHRPRGTDPRDDGYLPVTHCWRDVGRYGRNVAMIHCQRAQLARLTAALAEATARLEMATEFNVNGAAMIEVYGDGWTVHRSGDATDGKDFTEYLTPAGEWVRVVLSDDYPTHATSDAAFAALRAGGGR